MEWEDVRNWFDSIEVTNKHTSPVVHIVLLQLLHLQVGRVVVGAQDVDEVGDGEHAHKLVPRAVPQRRGTDAVLQQRKEGLLHRQLRVEHHQLGADRDEVIAAIELEETDIDQVLVDVLV